MFAVPEAEEPECIPWTERKYSKSNCQTRRSERWKGKWDCVAASALPSFQFHHSESKCHEPAVNKTKPNEKSVTVINSFVKEASRQWRKAEGDAAADSGVAVSQPLIWMILHIRVLREREI